MARPVTDRRLKKLARKLAGTKQVQRASGRSRMSSGPSAPKNLLALPPPGDFPKFWSFSRWANWRDCARYYLLDKVKKLIPFVGNSATERGDAIHQKARAYLIGKTRGLPDELKSFRKEFASLKRMGAVAEEEWTLTDDEQKTRATDWARAWLRAKVDALVAVGDDGVLLIVDYKTGRLKIDKHQADLYAATSIFYYPEAKEIHVELWFLDQDHVEPFKYTSKEARSQWKKWRERAGRMLSDREFKPKPGRKCAYCQYRSDKELPGGQSGPCDAWRDAA